MPWLLRLWSVQGTRPRSRRARPVLTPPGLLAKLLLPGGRIRPQSRPARTAFWPLVLAAAVGLATSAPVAARDIFVNNVSGSPHYDGLVPEPGLVSGPVPSLEHALRIVRKGDRIIMADTGVPYYESVTLQTAAHCGTPQQAFTIDGGGAILDGSRPIPPEFWRHYLGKIYALPLRKRGPYQMLFLDGKPLPRVEFDDDQPIELPPLHWGYYEGSIYLRLEPNKLPEDYHLSLAWHPVGITLYHVNNVVISNLIVQGFLLDGINVNDKVDRCLLGGLVCRGNGRSGIAVAGSSRAIIEGCLLGDNGAAQLWVQGHTIVDVLDCDLLAKTAPAVMHQGGRLTINPPLQPQGEAGADPQAPAEEGAPQQPGDDNEAEPNDAAANEAAALPERPRLKQHGDHR